MSKDKISRFVEKFITHGIMDVLHNYQITLFDKDYYSSEFQQIARDYCDNGGYSFVIENIDHLPITLGTLTTLFDDFAININQSNQDPNDEAQKELRKKADEFRDLFHSMLRVYLRVLKELMKITHSNNMWMLSQDTLLDNGKTYSIENFLTTGRLCCNHAFLQELRFSKPGEGSITNLNIVALLKELLEKKICHEPGGFYCLRKPQLYKMILDELFSSSTTTTTVSSSAANAVVTIDHPNHSDDHVTVVHTTSERDVENHHNRREENEMETTEEMEGVIANENHHNDALLSSYKQQHRHNKRSRTDANADNGQVVEDDGHKPQNTSFSSVSETEALVQQMRSIANKIVEVRIQEFLQDVEQSVRQKLITNNNGSTAFHDMLINLDVTRHALKRNILKALCKEEEVTE